MIELVDLEMLDDDTAAGELGGTVNLVVEHAVRSAERTLVRQGAGEFAAQLGLLLHFRAEMFLERDDDAASIRAGIAKNRAALEEVAPKAREILELVMAGEPVKDARAHVALLRAKHSRAYLQELADRVTEDADLMIGDGMTIAGYLVVLSVLAHYVELQAEPLKRFVTRLRAAYRDAEDWNRQALREELSLCKKLLKAASADE